MALTSLDMIYSEWQNNPSFRAAFLRDPEKALKQAGFEVSPEDLQKIRNILKDEDTSLDDRINQ